MIRQICIIVALASAFLWGQSQHGHAQTGTEFLTAAAKSMEKGDYNAAIEKIGEAFQSGKLDLEMSAKAYLMRGQAYEKQTKPALALADYTNAIFLQGLSNNDRSIAVDGRKRALAALGIADDVPTGLKKAGVIKETADAGAKPDPVTPAAPERTASSGGGGGITGFFGGLFSNAPTSAEAKPEPKPAAKSWEGSTRITAVAPAAGAQPAAPAPSSGVAQPSAAPEDGKFFNIHLATVSTEADAQSEVMRLSSKLSELLQGNTPEIARIEKGDTVLYRVFAGPFEGTIRSRAICDAMKSKGVSCLVVSR